MEITLEQRKHQINIATLWGVVINIVLAVVKVVGGIYGHSVALVADGLDSLSDLASDGMVLIAARQAGVDADEDHPYGHARYETLATVAMGLILMAVGFGIGYVSISRLIQGVADTTPSSFTLYIAAASIISKEALYHYTRRVGLRVRSKLLEATAWHHRTDAASSIVVFVGIGGSLLGFAALDAYAALIVAVMVLKVGYDLSLSSVQELVDTALDPEIVELIRARILANEDVRLLHMLRTRHMGHNALVYVHIQVAPKLSVSEGHHISEAVEYDLIENFDAINDVTVHIDPENDECEASNKKLPLRSELIIALSNEWKKAPALAAIDDITLHYLSGKISVEASLPLSSVQSLEDTPELQRLFREHSLAVACIGEAHLSFH